jgi:phosphoribosylformylglycinamidine synthase subunit PurQ / glutaminase
MKAAVVVFPGSNREHDIVDAIERSSGKKPVLVWHSERDLPKLDLIVLPGGFSYGDYLRTGAIAAHSPIMREVKARADKGVPVLGVCNGFQILCEAGLLPGVLLTNASLKFICRNVGLKVEQSDSLFTRRYNAGDVLSVPVAHGMGNYFADPKTLDALEGEGRVAFRYCTAEGAVNDEGNANGSARNIAGIFNARKNVLGMMPHPENATDPKLGSISGKPLFDSIAEALA